MQYYRCKCGKCESYGSMSPDFCDGCDECNTTLETHPGFHKKPNPHKFKPQSVETNNGEAKLDRCIYCWRTRKEIEKTKEKKKNA